jgi:hypothetical protein
MSSGSGTPAPVVHMEAKLRSGILSQIRPQTAKVLQVSADNYLVSCFPILSALLFSSSTHVPLDPMKSSATLLASSCLMPQAMMMIRS